ncbi:MAG: ABC transporter substrate-binding protein [Pseudomonadota bacterium]|nr:ABC transporter substrate-binding protein [Pseudomonadota bacterium]
MGTRTRPMRLGRVAQATVAALTAVGLWIAVLLPLNARSAETGNAGAVVSELQAALLAVMKQANALGYRGRVRRLTPVITETHDLPSMARYAMGRYWQELSPKDRNRLVDVFTRFSIANYAARFDSYKGQTFKQGGTKPQSRKRILVQTVLVKSGREEVELNYVLQERSGRWRIVNVMADGVSELAVRRSEFASVLRREGFPALLDDLEAKILELAQ